MEKHITLSLIGIIVLISGISAQKVFASGTHANGACETVLSIPCVNILGPMATTTTNAAARVYEQLAHSSCGKVPGTSFSCGSIADYSKE